MSTYSDINNICTSARLERVYKSLVTLVARNVATSSTYPRAYPYVPLLSWLRQFRLFFLGPPLLSWSLSTCNFFALSTYRFLPWSPSVSSFIWGLVVSIGIQLTLTRLGCNVLKNVVDFKMTFDFYMTLTLMWQNNDFTWQLRDFWLWL